MKRAIVIGATSGIGRGLAEELAARGYRVGLVGRREALLREIAAADPAAYSCAVADVTQPDAALAALDGLVAVLGGLELCIVAAGTGDLNPDLDFAVEASAIRTNILGWTAVVDWACRLFERQRGGSGLQRLESLSDQLRRGVAPAGREERTAGHDHRHTAGAGRYGDGQRRGVVLGAAGGEDRRADSACRREAASRGCRHAALAHRGVAVAAFARKPLSENVAGKVGNGALLPIAERFAAGHGGKRRKRGVR